VRRFLSARLAFAPLAVLSAALVIAPAPAQAQTTRILVMPFENVTREGRIFWLGEASAVLLADSLNALGAHAITRDERRAAFDRLQVPPAASLTDATVIRIGQLVEASEVVVGTLQLEGDSLVVRARSIALGAGRIQVSATETAPMVELFGIFERVAKQLAPAAAAGSGPLPSIHPPIAAFENYVKGLLAETPPTAINYLNAALQADPGFDRARLALWEVYDEQAEHERALAAVAKIPETSAWQRRARFLTGLSQLNLKRYDDAFATFKRLNDARPTATALNNIGVVQMRRGGSTPQTGMPAFYFAKAAEEDASEPDYFFNLGYADFQARDIQAAIYWLREAVRRDPADGEAHFVLGAALTAAGNATEAAREKELARRLSSTYEEWERRPAAEQVPKGLERVKKDVELPHSRRVEETLANSGQRDQRELARFYLDRGRRLFEQENDREAMLEFNRALFLSPYEADAHLLIGRIHLRNGRAPDAIDALKISLWSQESVPAHVALAQAYIEAKELDAARREIERALVLDPAAADAKWVLQSLTAR
jgi:tetratricopeptide (TPR) repeat protein